jgi:hypothetical protein
MVHTQCLARLWAEIGEALDYHFLHHNLIRQTDSNYFVNLHGEANPRLSRTQRLFPEPCATTTFWLIFTRFMLFGAPDHFYVLISELWVDRISYAAHWSQFVARCTDDWKSNVNWVRSAVRRVLPLLMISRSRFSSCCELHTSPSFPMS